MSRTIDDYQHLLISLLPKGFFWNTKTNSVLGKLLKGLADELVRIEEKTEDLVKVESISTLTTELLQEFEEEFDILGDNKQLGLTTAQRRNSIHTKLISRGAQDETYWINIAAALGWTITIEQFQPFYAGYSTANSPCGEYPNLFYFMVWITITSGMNYNISELITIFKKFKQVHTDVLFEFYGAEFSRAFSWDYNRIQHYDGSWYNLFDFGRDFSNAFNNAYDYDGITYTGAFDCSFSIDIDRHSGGAFSTEDFAWAEFASPK